MATTLQGAEASKKEKRVKKEKKEEKRTKLAKKEKKDKQKKEKEKKVKTRKRQRTEEEASGGAAKKARGSPSSESTDVSIDVGDNGIAVDPNSIDRFRLSDSVKGLLRGKGIESLFAIQAQTLDFLLDGSDVVGRARTGSGKTLAFVLPIVEKLMAEGGGAAGRQRRAPAAIVLAPTRELAKQVAAEFDYIGKAGSLRSFCIYGGTPYRPQEEALRRGVDVLVGTPGRVKDHLQRGTLDLSKLKFQILDECDEMLNMGFVDDVELILNGVGDRSGVQTLLFSATLPTWVKTVTTRFLKKDHKVVDLVGTQKLKASSTVKHLALYCHWSQKVGVVSDLVKCYGSGGRSIVFTETKSECDELAGELSKSVGARAIHGDIAQQQREFTLAGFRNGKFGVLVATDVAARGLDIDKVELVIQATLPKDPESYIHRSGRTGRAGRTGISISLVDRKREGLVGLIESKAGVKFERIGAPQAQDMAKMSGDKLVAKMTGIDAKSVEMFKSAAEAATKVFDSPIHALAAALACMAGHSSEFQGRSLLTAHKDLSTLMLTHTGEIRSPGFIFSVLHRIVQNEEAVNAIQGMTLTADGHSAVFDVQRKDLDLFKKAMARELANNGGRGGMALTVPTSLPELKVKDCPPPPTSRWGNGGGGRRFGSGSFPKGSLGGGRGNFAGRGGSRKW
ncbi:unnamed protein product [Ostreobium quekettii]|uniref:RNA helicase n=1 Tax=Ostreobium quekettii TaxID=121088 RepID=A0A8S1JC39_9CHLO|nr:unnamed protein product [Ostreobium quekettii]|eukprot:evm.model.scf_18.29 EVM.evm.TU.scf_18.29   scf_18:180406-184072(+)